MVMGDSKFENIRMLAKKSLWYVMMKSVHLRLLDWKHIGDFLSFQCEIM